MERSALVCNTSGKGRRSRQEPSVTFCLHRKFSGISVGWFDTILLQHALESSRIPIREPDRMPAELVGTIVPFHEFVSEASTSRICVIHLFRNNMRTLRANTMETLAGLGVCCVLRGDPLSTTASRFRSRSRYLNILPFLCFLNRFIDVFTD